MKKLFFLLLIFVLIFAWARNFIVSGRFEIFLDNHPNPQLNSKIEYYWASALSLFNHRETAKYRYKRIIDKYPETIYHPLAWFEYINVLEVSGQKNEAVREAAKFIENYPEHSKTRIVQKKLEIMKYGY
ncbi:MAG: hypothetical protein JW871_00470 [Endomicrobiales bacterium]|nr:hypothetical protein [Endomicrobiales bacterium]